MGGELSPTRCVLPTSFLPSSHPPPTNLHLGTSTVVTLGGRNEGSRRREKKKAAFVFFPPLPALPFPSWVKLFFSSSAPSSPFPL